MGHHKNNHKNRQNNHRKNNHKNRHKNHHKDNHKFFHQLTVIRLIYFLLQTKRTSNGEVIQALHQARSTFYVLWATTAEFGLHAGNNTFSTQNEN
jgi:hypothetical protein